MDWGADRGVLLRLYRSLVRSKLDYGAIVYGSARPSYLKRLETIQNQALRLCLGAFRTSPISSLHVEANEPPLHVRREQLAVQYALKLRTNPTNPAYDVTFNPRNTHFYESKPNAIRSFGLRIKDTLNGACPDLDQIAMCAVPKAPPWLLNRPNVNLSLATDKKGTTEPTVFLNKFREIKDEHSNRTAIYTDGSKDAERVGAAAVMTGKAHKMRLPNVASIFTAELKAISLALGLIARSAQRDFIIFSDSLSALEAITGSHCDNQCILNVQLLYSVLTERGKDILFVWVPSHIGIAGNEMADKAAREALDEDVSAAKVPFADLKPHIRKYFKDKWQTLWDESLPNKLHDIMPELGEWPEGCREHRREEIVLARARIGHTYLTHSYLLKDEPVPECIPCQSTLSVKHILIDCIDFQDTRRRYFNVESTSELFETIDPTLILDFIREIGLFYRF